MSNPTHLDELKDELSSLLKQEPTDFQNILRVTAEIAKEETSVVRFTTDAAMVRRLGRELVAKQETALAELVKNSYDADASHCTVTLEAGPSGGSMQIIDNGSGMSRSDLENGFMRLASDAKVKSPVSTKYLRSRAGKKGIGRFATERLGRQLTIVTQTEAEDHAWTVTIDWTAFKQGEDLNLIANTIVQAPKECPNGTRLTIKKLNDTWSDAELRRVYRYLSTLLQPVVEDVQSGSVSTDPGFVVQLVRSGENTEEPQTVVNADTEILGHALAVIDAEIDSTGKTTWSLSCPRFDISIKEEPIGLDRDRPALLPEAKNVKLKAHYFIRLQEFLGHSLGFIRDQLDEYGGIRLYRNGYRVPPYGDKGNDWLQLDRKRSRTWAPINSKAFIGFVALTDPIGDSFEETSSREGLIETEAFRDTRNVISAVLEAAVLRIESVRGIGPKRNTSRDESSGDRAAAETEAAAAELEEAMQDSAVSDAVAPADRDRLVSAVSRAAEAARLTAEVARERDDLLKELNLLRILASMGLTIAEFTHDFSHFAQTMELSVLAIKRAAETSAEALDASLARFDSQFRLVRAYTSHFGNMMTSNASRDLQPIDLYAFARTFREDMKALFDRRGYEFVVERPIEYDIYTTKMHPSEWSSILLNLLTNAIKAAKRAQRQGKFLIRVGTAGAGSVFLEFCDNGDGIPKENWSRVFDAFFTTTGGAAAQASDIAQVLGTGLGLKIAADIVHSVNGSVEVVDPPESYATCIRLTVPAGSPELTGQGEA
jgi:signal transduction histidine kinase